MEVNRGYKLTEVGVIPEDWDAQPLSSVLSKGRLGGNYANRDAEAELPLMKMGNLGRGYFDLSKVQFITPGVRPEPAHQLVYGDVLFNTRNTLDLVGKVAIWRDELPVAYYNSNLMRLEFDPEQVCSSEYANYSLNTEGAVSRLRALATGTTSVAAIYTRDLLKLQVLVPPKPEQRAIATALSDVDALLGGLERLIAKKRDLKQAAMQQLLTGQTRLPGFLGEWEVRRLEQSCELITKGTTPTSIGRDFTQNGLNFLKAESISEAGAPLLDKVAFIDTATNNLLKRSQLKEGDLLLSIAGVLGRVGRVTTELLPANTNQALAIIRLAIDSELERDFLFYCLRSAGTAKQICDVNVQAAQANISLQNVRDLEIRVPPTRSEQTAIAEVLTGMDVELAALEQRREKTGALKQAMMQELLTGRTRLVSVKEADA